MTFDFNRARQHLQSFNLRKLFIEEMGWDQPGTDLNIPYGDDILNLEAIAQKRGFCVYVCSPQEDGHIPGYAGRKKIEAELRKSIHEHILIFTNLDNSRQIWQWVRREPGRPTTSREYEYRHGQSGDPLLQRLQKLVVTLEEEENLGIVDVTSRVRAAFDVEPVTRRFYDRYSKEHAAFMQFLKGIPSEEDQRWYASVTLNRLMFVYFIQKRLFLNNDEDYLRSKLTDSQHKGTDLFYRDFLCPLFFEGFAVNKSDRKPEVNRLLGDVPYLNGGIFQKHQLENTYGKQIRIPDSAFERIFDFFDQYRWHLDERPLRNDREINPDVLGYIFEKYINQKEMGAYYTKEDITGYISRSTILPYLLDQTKKDCAIAFTGDHSVWNLLSADPNRYIFPSVQKGVGLDLPPEIEAGINDVSKRIDWNKTASEEYSLPAETWREVIARRLRYADLHNKLVSSEIREINDLITYNLDIEQFTQDLIESSEGPELLRAFWKVLKGITILDPTCGSGAFLFAALNILEPLYEACLERMRIFIVELDQSGEKHRPEKFSDFHEVLDRVEKHHNERYFILKSIIVNNLYGVDIMDEAVEICKLRLFLKLIAQVDQAEYVEPLPDIDFNIRSGNTLVGFTSIEEVRKALMNDRDQMRILDQEEEALLELIEEEADLANRAYLEFQRQQLEKGSVTLQDKANLQARLDSLNQELSFGLAKTYGVVPNTVDYSIWFENHRPLHWLIDFYGIMNDGGFDVIIGNPPYVSYTKKKFEYHIRNYETEHCGNLYAFVVERCAFLMQKSGYFGMIVPIASVATDSMKELQDLILNKSNTVWCSHFATRPGKLFLGVDMNLSIIISQGQKKHGNSLLFSTTYNRWRDAVKSDRNLLFQKISYINLVTPSSHSNQFPKFGSEIEIQILDKLHSHKKKVSAYKAIIGPKIFYHSGGRYWRKALLEKLSSHYKELIVSNQAYSIILSLLNSQLFYWYWITNSNCMDLVRREVDQLPMFNLDIESGQDYQLLVTTLMAMYKDNSIQRTRDGKLISTKELNIDVSACKPQIDKIDMLLGRDFGFSDEELDFILNYDYKFRMGADSEESD